jgi:hypothetical protein
VTLTLTRTFLAGPVLAGPMFKDKLPVILGLLACAGAPIGPELARKLNVISTMETLHGRPLGIAPSFWPWFNIAEFFASLSLTGWYALGLCPAQAPYPAFVSVGHPIPILHLPHPQNRAPPVPPHRFKRPWAVKLSRVSLPTALRAVNLVANRIPGPG